MGLARHQKKYTKKKKPRIVKEKRGFVPNENPTYMADSVLSKLSSKVCEIALQTKSPEKIRRLFMRNLLTAEQYVLVTEHAETKLEELTEQLIEAVDMTDQKMKELVADYKLTIRFLNELRKFFAKFFKIDEITNILGVVSVEDKINEVYGR
jgi:hypothetical protein